MCFAFLRRLRWRVLLIIPIGLAAGCTWTSAGMSSKIDYQAAKTRSTPLEVPPDLSQLPKDERFTVPERPQTVTASSAAAARPGSPTSSVAAATTAAAIAPTAEVAKIERQGSQRWLAVNMPPEKAWPILLDFWPSVGLAVEKSDAATGVMETVWAENKAKLDQGIIRQTLGRLLGSVYSTGEQDKYRARIERTGTDSSEIFISHRGMIEVFTSSAQDRTAWQPRPPDPEMEAEMLQRLLVRFDNTATKSVAATRAATPVTTAAVVTTPVPVDVSRITKGPNGRSERLEIDDPLDRAWRRVGLALDRGGFTVEERDRAKGIYFVRYLDPDYEAKQKEQQGFLTRMLGKEKPVPAPQYRVQITAAGDSRSVVQVYDKDGKPERSQVGDRILALLNDQLR